MPRKSGESVEKHLDAASAITAAVTNVTCGEMAD
jgi:hypothetical protein